MNKDDKRHAWIYRVGMFMRAEEGGWVTEEGRPRRAAPTVYHPEIHHRSPHQRRIAPEFIQTGGTDLQRIAPKFIQTGETAPTTHRTGTHPNRRDRTNKALPQNPPKP
jgi:hypothetical protein